MEVFIFGLGKTNSLDLFPHFYFFRDVEYARTLFPLDGIEIHDGAYDVEEVLGIVRRLNQVRGNATRIFGVERERLSSLMRGTEYLRTLMRWVDDSLRD